MPHSDQPRRCKGGGLIVETVDELRQEAEDDDPELKSAEGLCVDDLGDGRSTRLRGSVCHGAAVGSPGCR